MPQGISRAVRRPGSWTTRRSPALEEAFVKWFLIPQAAVFREYVKGLIETLAVFGDDPKGLAMGVCSSKQRCERPAEATNGYVYHADYPGRDDNLSDWQKRVSPFRRVMACTPALGIGTDLMFVSLVIYLDYPFSMTDLNLKQRWRGLEVCCGPELEFWREQHEG
ncbi:hypothetical protein EDC01DRAFT_781552 [Geopyxis carbonaria]|nr:hypothetical protein EDC01DRAFT_781552 [Geopyxis carbonaria]